MHPANHCIVLDQRIPLEYKNVILQMMRVPTSRASRRLCDSNVDALKHQWVFICRRDNAFRIFAQRLHRLKSGWPFSMTGIARRKMQVSMSRHIRGASVSNETCLPLPSQTMGAIQLYRWCRFNSCAMCGWCHNMLPRPLTEKTLTKKIPPSVHHRHCQCCRAARDISAPAP